MVVRGIEVDWVGQCQQRPQGLWAATRAAMGNRDAAAQPGAAELLPGYQVVENVIVIKRRLVVADDSCHCFKQSFFADAGHTVYGARRGQDIAQVLHRRWTQCPRCFCLCLINWRSSLSARASMAAYMSSDSAWAKIS